MPAPRQGSKPPPGSSGGTQPTLRVVGADGLTSISKIPDNRKAR
jgi:hypothetical protein